MHAPHSGESRNCGKINNDLRTWFFSGVFFLIVECRHFRYNIGLQMLRRKCCGFWLRNFDYEEIKGKYPFPMVAKTHIRHPSYRNSIEPPRCQVFKCSRFRERNVSHSHTQEIDGRTSFGSRVGTERACSLVRQRKKRYNYKTAQTLPFIT